MNLQTSISKYKINLLKAESIGDLIAAETEIQRLQAVRIMSGKSSDKFNQWREKLLKILVKLKQKLIFQMKNYQIFQIK